MEVEQAHVGRTGVQTEVGSLGAVLDRPCEPVRPSDLAHQPREGGVEGFHAPEVQRESGVGGQDVHLLALQDVARVDACLHHVQGHPVTCLPVQQRPAAGVHAGVGGQQRVVVVDVQFAGQLQLLLP